MQTKQEPASTPTQPIRLSVIAIVGVTLGVALLLATLLEVWFLTVAVACFRYFKEKQKISDYSTQDNQEHSDRD